MDRLQEFLVNARNEDVTSKLFEEYGTLIAETVPEIHCVSKTIYWENRNMDRGIYKRHLELSGVRPLREHCISIMSESQHQAARRYMRDEIPVLVAKVELWVQSGAGTLDAERKQNIVRVCNEIEDRLSAVSVVRSLLNDHIV